MVMEMRTGVVSERMGIDEKGAKKEISRLEKLCVYIYMSASYIIVCICQNQSS